MTLLSHYWTAADSPEFRKLQMADWLEDLSPYAAMHVAEACKEWRRMQPDRRPTPGHILRLTRESHEAFERRRAPRIAGPGITNERLAELERIAKESETQVCREAADSRDAWARSWGYENFVAWNNDPFPRAPLPARFPTRNFPDRTPRVRTEKTSVSLGDLAPEAKEIIEG